MVKLQTPDQALAPTKPNLHEADPSTPEQRRSQWMSIWEGCATTVFLSWTTGIALIGYMKGVGATSEQVMLIALIPQLMQAVSPLGAWLLSRYPRPKLLIVTGTLIARSLFLIPALLPLLFYESFIREGGNPRLVWGVLALLAITQFFQCATGPIWLDWMASLVPQQRRGPYFGLRNGICGIVGLCAHLGGMMLLDYLQAPQNFQVLFAAGVLFAWLGIFLYTRQHEPQLNIARISLTRTFLEPLADRNFLRFLRYAVYWQAAVMLGATYLFDFFFEVQKFTFTQLGIYQAIAAFSSLVLGPLWGRLAMRVGNKAVLTFTTMIAASALPMTWLLMTPGDPTLLYLSGFIDAFAWSAINPAIVNLALVTAPPNKRAAYMSVMSLAQGLAGALGALLSWALLGMAQQFTFTLGRYEWTAYHWVFVVSISIRSFAFLLIAPIHESKAWRVRDVMRAFLAWRFTGFPWR